MIQSVNGKMNREFSKEKEQMANKYLKTCSTSSNRKEMQVKTTLRFHFTLPRIAIAKKANNKC
jgi:hypothetical protein